MVMAIFADPFSTGWIQPTISLLALPQAHQRWAYGFVEERPAVLLRLE
jgi:hypothetical protein